MRQAAYLPRAAVLPCEDIYQQCYCTNMLQANLWQWLALLTHMYEYSNQPIGKAHALLKSVHLASRCLHMSWRMLSNCETNLVGPT